MGSCRIEGFENRELPLDVVHEAQRHPQSGHPSSPDLECHRHKQGAVTVPEIKNLMSDLEQCARFHLDVHLSRLENQSLRCNSGRCNSALTARSSGLPPFL